jgi:hypothetical protein
MLLVCDKKNDCDDKIQISNLSHNFRCPSIIANAEKISCNKLLFDFVARRLLLFPLFSQEL